MTLERKESSSWLRRFGDRWGARDLVVIGVFAATAKLSTVLIAMVGGGMNPVSLLLKNVVFTTLLVIMLYKVRQPGTLSLFVIVSALVNFLLLGGNVTLIPPMLAAALVSEASAGKALFSGASAALTSSPKDCRSPFPIS